MAYIREGVCAEYDPSKEITLLLINSLANIYPYIFMLSVLGIGKMELYIVIGISLSAGFLIFLLVHFVVAPWLKKRILAEEQLQPNYALTDEELNDVSSVPEIQLNDEMPGLYYRESPLLIQGSKNEVAW